MNIFLLYPTQLFKNIDLLQNKKVYLIEDPIFFLDFQYHKLKLAYHRATMKKYQEYIKNKNINITYINFENATKDFYNNINNISSNKIEIYQVYDNKLMKKCKKYFKNIIIHESLNFLVNKNMLDDNKSIFYKNNHYNHSEFYKMQRRRLNILMNNDGTPKGDRWSFDKNNREKLPKDIKIPNMINIYDKNKNNDKVFIDEAKKYILEKFPNNYGSLDNFIYPITHKDTLNWLEYFCKKKFENFGKYEDAETIHDPFIFHSVLTPMMNIGLITDNEVLLYVKKYENKICIESYEGFIRQIIGWRNYVLTVYIYEGDKLKKMNFMKHTNKLNNDLMWSENIGILPFDNIIKKINKYAYAHHIERLMYLGNFLFLCQINPNDVYKIFMEWTIDAYDWVMVPNVYCMSQFADGGLMMKKPYFSSYNYILRMSDYKKDKWCDIWYNIYYNFINTHQNYLKKNYSTAVQVKNWRNKSNDEKKNILLNAKVYLRSILK